MKKVLILIFLVFVSCSSSKKISKENTKTQNIQTQKNIEKTTFQDEFLEISDLEPIKFSVVGKQKEVVQNENVKLYFGEEISQETNLNEFSVRKTDGFRIQIASTKLQNEAKELSHKFEDLFPDEKSYIVFDVPYYKVRAGNFISRFEATKFLQVLVENGFSNPWIVKTEIEVYD